MIRSMARAPVDAIRKVPLFAELDDSELARLADRFVERSFKEGETVVEEGATGTSVFVIVDGNATVSVGGEMKASLGPGDYFGEMAAMDDGTRSASIVAATDLDVCFLTPWEFRPFVEEHPEVGWKLLRSLARRLREAQSGSQA
jgi:CRP/FNR family cyclic AMP-dependent transcriptional regulator